MNSRSCLLILSVILSLCCSLSGLSQTTIVLDHPINGKDYSQVISCHFDQTRCSQKGTDTEVQVILMAGEWTINSTISLTYRDQLILDYGASIVRAQCRTTEPLIHLKGKYSAVIGKSKNLIKSKCNNLQDGIIKIGHSSATSRGNLISCQVQNLLIQGPTDLIPTIKNGYSNRAFDQITGIYIYSNQNEPNQKHLTASYYHTLRDIDIAFVSTGVHFYNSTACTLDNILLNRVGIHGGHGILIQGGLENKISNVHHGYSPNANSLSFTQSRYSYDPSFNTVVNYVVEIGKMKGDLARINGGGHCINIDVDPQDFYNNTITIGCNHPTSPKLRSGKSMSDYQTKSNRSVIK